MLNKEQLQDALDLARNIGSSGESLDEQAAETICQLVEALDLLVDACGDPALLRKAEDEINYVFGKASKWGYVYEGPDFDLKAIADVLDPPTPPEPEIAISLPRSALETIAWSPSISFAFGADVITQAREALANGAES